VSIAGVFLSAKGSRGKRRKKYIKRLSARLIAGTPSTSAARLGG